MQREQKSRVTYGDMWRDALTRAEDADDLLRAYAKCEDDLSPVDPEFVARAQKQLAIARGQANLIAWCERHKEHVAKSLAQEASEQAARELASQKYNEGEAA